MHIVRTFVSVLDELFPFIQMKVLIFRDPYASIGGRFSFTSDRFESEQPYYFDISDFSLVGKVVNWNIIFILFDQKSVLILSYRQNLYLPTIIFIFFFPLIVPMFTLTILNQ